MSWPEQVLLAALLGVVPAPLGVLEAQQAQPTQVDQIESADRPEEPREPVDESTIDGPYEAFDAGLYDRALQGFVDQQVERPDDPEVQLNIASAHYKMKDYEAAQRVFNEAAVRGDEQLRADVYYNLGNTAYRQGRLEEAIDLYQASLDLDPDDEDAKFNLEFVRDEIRRRHEEAQKRQEQQQQQQGQDEQEQDQQGEGDQPQQQEQDSGSEDQQEEQQSQPQGGEDRDGDGLPDETERSGENPTDPENPDSDEDGLRDGEEDSNRNGRVDEGETDPNLADSDGDGIDDGEEQRQASASPTKGEPSDEMTEEEAERYLQALEESRPDNEKRAPGRRRRLEKDW